jgi:hypothetical protein
MKGFFHPSFYFVCEDCILDFHPNGRSSEKEGLGEMSEDYNRIEQRVKTVEDAVRLLTNLALRADERMDGFDAGLSNLTIKIEALADAQIRTEEALTRQAEAHTRLEDAHTRLEEAHQRSAEAHTSLEEAHTRSVEAQTKSVEAHVRLEDAHTRLEEAHTRLAEAQTNLAQAQIHTDQRLDALIDIVREDREGRNGK